MLFNYLIHTRARAYNTYVSYILKTTISECKIMFH